MSLVLVGSCTVGDAPGVARETAQVSAEGVEFEVGSGPTTTEFHGITVSLPAGVAPVGTTVVLRREAQPGTRSPAVAVSDGLRVDLGEGLQPAQPVTLVFPLDRDELPAAEDAAQLLVVRSTSTDGQVRLYTGTYDAENATYTVDVDHLSNFQVFRLDLNAVLREVRTAIMQGLKLEYPKPDCVGQTATIHDVTYNVTSPPQSWLCLEADGDDLVVTGSPNSAIPYAVTSRPPAALMTLPSDVTLATSTIITIAQSINFIGTGQAAVMPGAHAELRYQPAPDDATLTFEQYPVLLLMAILATTIETITSVLGIHFVLADLLNDLQCLGTVAGTANRGVALNGETAGGIIRAFFDCVGPMMGDALGTAGVIITAILGAAPSYLIANLVGLVNELTGKSTTEIALEVQKPGIFALTSGVVCDVNLSEYGGHRLKCWIPKPNYDGVSVPGDPVTCGNGTMLFEGIVDSEFNFSCTGERPPRARLLQPGESGTFNDYVCTATADVMQCVLPYGDGEMGTVIGRDRFEEYFDDGSEGRITILRLGTP